MAEEIQKMNLESKNLISERIEQMKALFPEIQVEGNGSIDFEKLRLILGDDVDEGQERYAFTWPGKADAIRQAQIPSTATLRPDEADSVDWDTTENLYIEGDNLEVLKLLQRGYHGKVKMIYIDPPYNTGKDFIYKDSFQDSIEQYKLQAGLTNQSNADTSGRYHSDWLTMMYPRLKMARELLDEAGAILISIDENESHNLRILCDEIFGANNYEATFNVQVRYESKSITEGKPFKPVIEQILIYSKNHSLFVPNQPLEEYDLSKFCFSITENAPGESFMVGDQETIVFKPGEWTLTKAEDGSLDQLKETWITGSIYTNMSYGQVFQKIVEPRTEIDGLGCLYKVLGRGEDGLGYRYYTGPARAGSTKGKMFSGVPLERREDILSGKGSQKKKPIVCFADASADFGNIRNEGGVAFNSGKNQ